MWQISSKNRLHCEAYTKMRSKLINRNLFDLNLFKWISK